MINKDSKSAKSCMPLSKMQEQKYFLPRTSGRCSVVSLNLSSSINGYRWHIFRLGQFSIIRLAYMKMLENCYITMRDKNRRGIMARTNSVSVFL